MRDKTSVELFSQYLNQNDGWVYIVSFIILSLLALYLIKLLFARIHSRERYEIERSKFQKVIGSLFLLFGILPFLVTLFSKLFTKHKE